MNVTSPASVLSLVVLVLAALLPHSAAAQDRGLLDSLVVPVLEGRVDTAEARPPQRLVQPEPTPDLLGRYRRARMQVLARRQVQPNGRIVAPLPLARHATSVDTLTHSPKTAPDTASAASSFQITSARRVSRLERAWFQRTFGDTNWSFLGVSGSRATLFDTTQTRALRARLQDAFGDPTQTLGDFDPREKRDSYVQFEYWFVVNDSIPVTVSDPNGPYDRGLIVATDNRHRDDLKTIRRALLEPLRDADRAPYVDYFYDTETNRWYRTGYDGASFFLTRTYRSRMTPGRRPWLDSARSTQAPAAGD